MAPLVVPDVLTKVVPELPPLTVPVLTPPLTATLLPVPLTPLTRPPQAAMVRSTNAVGDHRPWVRVNRSSMPRELSHQKGGQGS
jgi:hypothetical protein